MGEGDRATLSVPLRFVPGSDGADRNGHTVVPFALAVGRGRPFALERTRSPLWWDGSDREDPWTVPYEVDVPEVPRVRFVG